MEQGLALGLSMCREGEMVGFRGERRAWDLISCKMQVLGIGTSRSI